ncbi:MAG: PSD1 domain-containing protein [Planctomycetia bacterium]|nr:PSD1 domain-containing protein [Planctomycetia bacterium]
MRIIATLASLVLIGNPCVVGAAEAGKLPEPTGRQVDFHKDVLAILANSCAKCHAGGKQKGGFSIDTRESLLKGGESGPAVVVGKSEQSRLIELVAGLEPDTIMPAQGPRLTAEQVGLLRAWIDQGLPWEQGFTFKKVPSASLEPRRVTVPAPAAGSKSSNPIDLILESSLSSAGVKPAATSLVDTPPVASDRTYLRRVYLDLIGLVPSPDEADAFLQDRSGDKREKLVTRLLDDKQQYAAHWLTFWNDALRNDYRGTGYIDGGRLQITDWLAKSLADNLPYDQFVRQLINPTPESAGFIKGIVWRGVVNSSQVPPVQAAQNISQVFLGINLKCASCHDSFISDWKLADAYGLASVFADGPLEIHRCDQPTGKFAPMQFLFPQLGSIDAAAPKPQRLRQLAEVMTRSENGRLARTIVNRLWARLLGRGLVDPVDEMDNPPWNADLLDYLAGDLADHGYNLKHTISQIVGSRAYQLGSVDAGENSREDFVFRGPLVRRLSAEQFVDAVSSLTGIEYAPPAVKPAALITSGTSGSDEGSKANPVVQRASARASLVNADPLLIALGRSNREQVVTERPKTATTLQALELTNGTPLSTLLEKGAKKWAETADEPAKLVEQIYRRALSRTPSAAERTLALELLGPRPTAEGIEDLMWAIVMLPEFQLIY